MAKAEVERPTRCLARQKNRILKVNNVQQRGLCMLAVEEMYLSMKQDWDITWSVVFQMVEIYKNEIKSLVDTIEVKSMDETLEILAKGFRKRVWRGTQLNAQSSRSHWRKIQSCGVGTRVRIGTGEVF